MSRLNATLSIRTPEGVRFDFTLAGPVTRAVAAFVDMLVVTAINSVLTWFFLVFAFMGRNFALTFYIIAQLALTFVCGVVLEWFWNGQTVGKRLLGLRVIDARGLRLTFPQVLIRNIFRLIDQLPVLYALGGLIAWLSPKRQRLGDMAGGTVVTSQPPHISVGEVLGAADKWNTFRANPVLETRIRRAVSPEEADLLFRGITRREILNAESRLALYAELAAALRNRIPFPPGILEDMSDERLIRNILDVVSEK